MTKRQIAGLLALIGVAIAIALTLTLRSGEHRDDVRTKTATVAACDPSACPQLTCEQGFHAEAVAKACCPSCTRDLASPKPAPSCAPEQCAVCPPGSRPQAVEGQCCPSCVNADDDSCQQGRARYEARRAELEAELRVCAVDDDCMVASFGDACRASCPLPLNKRRLGSVVADLREEAAVHCAKCAPQNFDCPNLDPGAARCALGRCEFAPPHAQPVEHAR